MNQIISMETLEREELARFERKAKENLARRAMAEQAVVAAKEQEQREVEALMQRAQERREENELTALFGALGGIALALGCVAFDALWVLLVALGWVLGFSWKAVRKG